MNRPKGILIDIDGVLLQDGSPIHGSINKLNTLKEHCKIRLLTNTTTQTVSAIHLQLTSHGFLVEEIYGNPYLGYIKPKKHSSKKLNTIFINSKDQNPDTLKEVLAEQIKKKIAEPNRRCKQKKKQKHKYD